MVPSLHRREIPRDLLGQLGVEQTAMAGPFAAGGEIEKSPSCVLVNLEEEVDGVSYVTSPLHANVARLRLDWEDR